MYYSPLWLGVLAAAAFYWLGHREAAVACPLAALAAQVLVVALQGAFAQVLPVPWGRSLRGQPAAAAGWLTLAALVLGAAAAVLWVEGLWTAALVVTAAGGVALVVALIIYVWNIPAAVRDFSARG